MFPNSVPMDMDTLSPEPLVYLFIHSFIHVRLPQSPKRSLPTYGEKHKVTIHSAPCRREAYKQWGAAWFPKNLWCKSHSLSSYYYCPNTSIQQGTEIWLCLPQFSSSHGRAVKACKRNCDSNIYSTKDNSCTCKVEHKRATTVVQTHNSKQSQFIEVFYSFSQMTEVSTLMLWCGIANWAPGKDLSWKLMS